MARGQSITSSGDGFKPPVLPALERRFSWRGLAFATSVIVTALTLIHQSVGYNRNYLTNAGISPTELSIIDQNSLQYKLYSPTGSFANKLLPKAYGPYADHVKAGTFPISIDSPAEFVLPQIKVDDVVYLLRESPSLRYHLWEQKAPDVLLLGSSMFFMDFNRELFFEHYPDRYLIDFTMANNRPEISAFLLKKAMDRGLKFNQGTVVLYGINDWELASGYGASWDYVRESIDYELNNLSFSKRLSTWLVRTIGMRNYREYLSDRLQGYWLSFRTSFLSRAIGAEKNTAGEERGCARKEIDPYQVYIVIVPADCVGNTADLSAYLMAQIPKGLGVGEVPFMASRVTQLVELRDFFVSRGAKFVLVKLPTSGYSRARSPSFYHQFNRQIGEVVTRHQIAYYDASSFEVVGLDESRFLWSQRRFDLEHLNYEGSRILTSHILEQVYLPMLAGTFRSTPVEVFEKPGSNPNGLIARAAAGHPITFVFDTQVCVERDMGSLQCGVEYEGRLNAKTKKWTVVGPRRGDQAVIAVERPEVFPSGAISIWGSQYTFDDTGKFYFMGVRVGRIWLGTRTPKL